MDNREAEQFKRELSSLINRFGLDTELSVPDFLLASLLFTNLINLKTFIDANDHWHNREETNDMCSVQSNI